MPAPKATAPFNFVAAEEPIGWVVDSEDTGPRYSGSMQIQITALEPLLVCGPQQENTPRRFFERAGSPCIPATSIKGVVRTMLEALSMSVLTPVTPRRTYFRDLNNSSYLKRFVESDNGVSVYKSRAGYLRKGNDGWEILPCEWAKVSHDDLHEAGVVFPHASTRPAQRVDFLLNNGQAQRGVANPLPSTDNHRHPKTWNRDLTLRYRRIRKLILDGDARIVAAGHMSGRHFETVFYPPSTTTALPVQSAWEDFEEWMKSHKPREVLFRLLQSKAAKDMYKHGVPVFWLERAGYAGQACVVDAFGFSQLFCVPYRYAIDELTAPRLHEEPLSLAESIFGFADLSLGSRRLSRKGRVVVRAARCTKQMPALGGARVIPGNPSATCIGLYLEQPEARNVQRTARDHGLKTYDSESARVRGRKFYWHRPGAWGVLPPNPVAPRDQDNVSATYEPLPSGVEFNTTITVERLTEVELGAIFAAIKLPAGHAHKLGLGKPFGLGSVRLEIVSQNIINDRVRYSSIKKRQQTRDALKVDEFIKKFEACIGQICGSDFEAIPEIRSLRALTNYANAPDPKLTAYMPLQRPTPQDHDAVVYANKPVLPNAISVAPP